MRWTKAHLLVAVRELGRGPTVLAAAERLTVRFGTRVNPNALKEALKTAGYSTPSTYLPSNVKPIAETNAPPARSAPPPDDATIPAPPITAPGPADGGLAALLKLVRKGDGFELEELCDRLDLAPKRVLELVAEANKLGHDLTLGDAVIGQRPRDPSQDVVVAMPSPVTSTHKVALVGDVHIGSKHHLGAYFKDFYDSAYEAGCRTFIQVGDILDGVYRFSIWEQSHRGFEEQVDATIEGLPSKPDARWVAILGNHDETFERDSGISVVRAANDRFRAAGRDDFEFVGSRGAYLRLKHPGAKRGVVVELWHPSGKPAYALSYKMQNHIRDYAVGAKPDILAVGHWHQSCYFTNRGVHAFSCGCWQGGKSAYGRSLGGSPAIGSWLLEYSLTADETIREITPAWRAYYEGETPRDVELG